MLFLHECVNLFNISCLKHNFPIRQPISHENCVLVSHNIHSDEILPHSTRHMFNTWKCISGVLFIFSSMKLWYWLRMVILQYQRYPCRLKLINGIVKNKSLECPWCHHPISTDTSSPHFLYLLGVLRFFFCVCDITQQMLYGSMVWASENNK